MTAFPNQFNSNTPQFLSAIQFQYLNPTATRMVMDAAKELYRWVLPQNETVTKDSKELNHSLTKSQNSTAGISTEGFQNSTGKTSRSNTTHLKSSLTYAGSDTAQSWNEAERNLTGNLTRRSRVENRAAARTNNSINLDSTQKGHNNNFIYTQVHHYINYLVKVGIFPSSAVVGRYDIAGYTRTALRLNVNYLDEYRVEITDALEDKFGVDPDEVFKALEQACVIAAYNGLVEFDGEVLNRMQKMLVTMPKSMQSTLLRSSANMDYVRKQLSTKKIN